MVWGEGGRAEESDGSGTILHFKLPCKGSAVESVLGNGPQGHCFLPPKRR
jgi:hypothetical protein